MKIKRTLIASTVCALLTSAVQVHAQQSSEPAINLETVVVTGTPTRSELFDLAPPISSLGGPKLRYRLAPTIGETLSSEVGVNSSYYGPNASRPVIRGLGGEQIRILQNGVGAIDASGTSVDHAVSYDPLTVQRVEIVRGPAAVLYGTSGIGGVVNLIDNRIPSELPANGLSGNVGLRFGTVNDEQAGSGAVDVALGSFVLHLDAFKRDTNNVRIPGFQRSERLRATDPLPDDEEESKDKIVNSQSESNGGTIGGSFVWNNGYVGVSYQLFDTNYGTVAEEEVTIDLQQKRFDISGEVREPVGALKAIKFRLGQSNYTHTEFEGTEVGTVFDTDGIEGRFDLVHNKIGPLEGAVGFQFLDTTFSALGEEAFLPKVTTKGYAAFIYEELPLDKVKLQAGLRFDKQDVSAEQNDAFPSSGQTKSFNTTSLSIGMVYSFTEQYAIALAIPYTERAPNYQELFANGPHVATAQFEVGDVNLGKEKSTGLDLQLRKKSGRVRGSVGVFYNKFNNFIGLFPGTDSAGNPLPPEDDLPVFQYRGVGATFYGAEIDTRIRAIETSAYSLDFEFKADYVRARDTSNSNNLPRISPLRFGLGVIYQRGGWNARFDVQEVTKQNKVAPGELETDAYTMVNAGVGYTFNLKRVQLEAFLKGTNLLDEEARNHVSFLKDIAPLPGRGFLFGLNARF
jgi:iron complex outermembrane recepter protein